MINVLIVHYNTPHLTECLVKSINMFVKDATIYIFDNSDKLPFTAKFDNVKLLDNTKGQYIDFDKWLENYPDRINSSAKRNNYGSAKHCYSVDKCMDIINDNFILIDSDVLLKKGISEFYDEKYFFIGSTERWRTRYSKVRSRERAIPYLCFINVKKCKENNIRYFNDKCMYGLSSDGDNYDTGTWFMEQIATKKLNWKKINLNNFIVHYKAGSWVNDAKKYDGYKPIDSESWLNIHRKLWFQKNENNTTEKNKKVVYTCITGGYDSLVEPKVISAGFDYICFTDNLELKSNVWDIKPLPKETDELSQVKKQRYVKINPHKLLGDYELSIWVDGNVELKGDLNDFISKKIKDDDIICVPKHPQRNCIYEEERTVVAMKKDVKENTNPQINRYKKEGFPKKYGLLQSNILIRRHNSPDCIKLMEDWFEEVKNGSHRDQLSFNYAAWKNENVKVTYLDKYIYKSEWFHWHSIHKKAKPIVKTNPIINRRQIIKNEETPAPKTVSRIIPRSRRAFDKPNAVKTQNIGIYRI